MTFCANHVEFELKLYFIYPGNNCILELKNKLQKYIYQ